MNDLLVKISNDNYEYQETISKLEEEISSMRKEKIELLKSARESIYQKYKEEIVQNLLFVLQNNSWKINYDVLTMINETDGDEYPSGNLLLSPTTNDPFRVFYESSNKTKVDANPSESSKRRDQIISCIESFEKEYPEEDSKKSYFCLHRINYIFFEDEPISFSFSENEQIEFHVYEAHIEVCCSKTKNIFELLTKYKIPLDIAESVRRRDCINLALKLEKEIFEASANSSLFLLK